VLAVTLRFRGGASRVHHFSRVETGWAGLLRRLCPFHPGGSIAKSWNTRSTRPFRRVLFASRAWPTFHKSRGRGSDPDGFAPHFLRGDIARAVYAWDVSDLISCRAGRDGTRRLTSDWGREGRAPSAHHHCKRGGREQSQPLAEEAAHQPGPQSPLRSSFPSPCSMAYGRSRTTAARTSPRGPWARAVTSTMARGAIKSW
jgi:hypothetical protein